MKKLRRFIITTATILLTILLRLDRAIKLRKQQLRLSICIFTTIITITTTITTITIMNHPRTRTARLIRIAIN